MVNQIATYVALGVVVLFFAFLVWALIWRAAMARLSLKVPEGEVLPGEVVDTVLRIEAKRALQWERIVVSLTCEHESESTKRGLIYRDETKVSGPGRLGAGAIAEYPVQFTTPTKLDPSGIELIMPDAVEAVLGPLIEATQSHRDRDFKWSIEAQVHCKMVLSTGRRLNLKLAP